MFEKMAIAMLCFFCVLIILANNFGHELSNNVFDDYNQEMVVVDTITDIVNKVGVFTQTMYKTFSDGGSMVGSAIDALNGGDSEPSGLYHHQPAYWIYSACGKVSTPAFADPEQIDAFFDEVYQKIAVYFDDKKDAALAMDELAEKCYFLYDASGALFVTYNASVKFDYVDNLHTRNFFEGFSSWIIAKFVDDFSNSPAPTVTVNGYRLGTFKGSNGDLVLNGIELAMSSLYYTPGQTYFNRAIGAIPFDRDVWQACCGNRPTSWYLVGGVSLS